MAYQTEYYISATAPAAWVDALNIDAVLQTTPLTGSRAPVAQWKYPNLVTRPDGQNTEVGLPALVWRFDVLRKEQYTNLRAFFTAPSMPVWIRTRNPEDYGYSSYTGIAHRPDADDKRKMGDKFLGVELVITRLEDAGDIAVTSGTYPTTGVITAVTAVRTASRPGVLGRITVTIIAYKNTTVSITGDEGIVGRGPVVAPLGVFVFPGTFAADGTVAITDTIYGSVAVQAGW